MGVNARRVAAVAGSLSLVLAACLAAVALVLQPSGSPTALLNEDTRHLKPSAEVVKQSLQTTEQSYASLHPVYIRCTKEVEMEEFTATIERTCGDIHELPSCSAPCAETMRAHAEKFGCCWETVMQAYAQLDPKAASAWRSWQGTLSGKCGISFDDKSCGDSAGEGQYHKLEEQVKTLESSQAESQALIKGLVAELGGLGRDLCELQGEWVPCSSMPPQPQQPASPSSLHALHHGQQHAGAWSGGRGGGGRAAAAVAARAASTAAAAALSSLHLPRPHPHAHALARARAAPHHPQLRHAPHPPSPAAAAKVKAKAKKGKGAGGGKKAGGARGAAVEVEPDFGLALAKHAVAAGAKKKAQVPKAAAAAMEGRWPWEKGAFKTVEQLLHLRAHTHRAHAGPLGPMADTERKLAHPMSVVASPLGGGGGGAEPLWRLWDAKPSASSRAAAAKHTAPSQTHSLFGRSHAWGPADDRLALLRGPAAPKGVGEEGLGATNSPWAVGAGLGEEHDPAGRRLKRLGLNVNGGFQSWV